jgi:hypothetical protein
MTVFRLYRNAYRWFFALTLGWVHGLKSKLIDFFDTGPTGIIIGHHQALLSEIITDSAFDTWNVTNCFFF